MKPTVYIETSIPSYLTARTSRDIRAAAWQQITQEWWDEARHHYELFTSELTLLEASAGHEEAAKRRLEALETIPELKIDSETQQLAELMITQGGIPAKAQADALHVAIAALHRIDYLLTWNCRHIDNAAKKPIIRAICLQAGYHYPEICTPIELQPENVDERG
ncbi:PIN domain-containing protein [Ectothiorhodospiraceae bacterium BW-2]|nr:PIN domain-containing protein [Ectothiorhodospiraceae bacterium BW-2]